MKTRVLPVMISTQEALKQSMKEGLPLLYFDRPSYEHNNAEIRKIMEQNGYVRADFPARRGVFYAKGVDVKNSWISDPCKLF